MARPGMADSGMGRASARQMDGGGGRGPRGGGGGMNDRGGDDMGGRGGARGAGFGRRKVCRFCADKNAKVDYKDYTQLKYFLSERGKIIPRRISGNCATHQRQVATAIKRTRQIALLPYTVISG